MTAAVITLSLAVLALGTGMVLAIRYAIKAHEASNASHDLYRAQVALTDDVRAERDELVGKLAATDEQLREAKIRLSKVEEQRNRALDEARELVRKEIRSAPDAIAALNKVLAAGPRDSVQPKGSAETKTDSAKTDSGAGRVDPLQITELR